MKKAKRTEEEDDLRPEYDLRTLRVVARGPGWEAMKRAGIRSLAELRAQGKNIVILDSDVAKEFRTPKDVNDTLRAVAKMMRQRRKYASRISA